jgi:hypothetical protein
MAGDVTFSIDGTDFDDHPYVELDWTATTEDGDFVAWRVYRRLDPLAPWTMLAEILTAATKVYHDYTAPAFVEIEYAVTQVDADPSESTKTAQDVTVTHDHYHLACPVLDISMPLFHVIDDEFEDEVESASIKVLGRGRRYEVGDDQGIMGNLTAMLYNQTGITAREQRIFLQSARKSNNVWYMRNPFGDIFSVALASLSITRVSGVGKNEYAEARIGYEQLSESAPPISVFDFLWVEDPPTSGLYEWVEDS